MIDDFEHRLTAVATVRATARLVGLSASRFYQLQQAGVFPLPVYDINTRRPLYTEEQQRQCLEIRRRNCGINGKPVLFYARRSDAIGPVPRKSGIAKLKASPANGIDDGIVESLKSLGLNVTAQVVGDSVRKLYPGGTAGTDPAAVIRAVFLDLKRRDSGDSVGR